MSEIYESLFRKSSVCGGLVDGDHNILLKSDRGAAPAKKQLSESDEHPVYLPDNTTLLKSIKTDCGRFYWYEDNSELLRLNEELSDTGDYLLEESAALNEAAALEEAKKRTAEQNRLFDGMTEVLEALKESPMKVAVCTSKNERLARDVIDYLHIGGYLDAICGSLDGGKRKQKEELIPYALEVLGCARDRAVMVGDTCFDTRGAVACGVDFLGVLYGYGRLDTMQAAGAVRFVDTPKEILNYLL